MTKTTYTPEKKHGGWQVRQDNWDVFGEFRNSVIHPEWFESEEACETQCMSLEKGRRQ